ncbi:hypothetical protein ARMGADRAFT_1082967 [Armillaria gallica]|uniref:Transmembrane protein n=1 Tax=Armillaria gallica TaxID=47427 RepID=A0A2H3DGU3_ARMGA|nr:hypothetical protein ARMGADRAFT_1082967 [Armillaria gallica]
MPAIRTTNTLNTRKLIAVVLAAFFSATGILLILAFCIIAYDTARIEEDEEEARAALPFHYIPQHHLIPEPSITLLPKARTRPTEPEPTPLAAHNARREYHQPQSILPVDARNVRAEDEPDEGVWIGEAIAALLQPLGEPQFRDLHPDFELPNAPLELNPVPSYEVRDLRELPRPTVPSYFPLALGYRRTPTLIPPTSPDPLSDDDDFQTPRPSPIHSPTPAPSDQTTTPSTQEDQTMSGPSSKQSTGKYSAPIEPQHGNSDDETSSSGLSGPMLGILESTWTSTLPPRVETQSWENRPTPAWPHSLAC